MKKVEQESLCNQVLCCEEGVEDIGQGSHIVPLYFRGTS